MNKGEITSKVQYKSAIDALLDDYTSNKSIYQELFNENIFNHSMNHQFLEGIYIKYAQNLDKYMKENKYGMKLSGNKKYENVPIDLFIKNSREYKEAIISELHNKYTNKEAKTTLDKIFLTPLPDKPRILLTTQQQKEEFQAAERLAVVMRTVEYTNALRNQGNQYFLMKKDERQQMIYIIKRATNTIQNWWKKNGKQGVIRRRKRESEKKIRKQKLDLVSKTISKILNKKINPIQRELFNQMKKYIKKKGNEITRFYLSFITKLNIKRVTNKQWSYYSKSIRSACNLTNCNGKYLNPLESIILIQHKIKKFLNSKNKKNSSKNNNASLLRIVKYKDKIITRSLLKSFLRWIRILYYPTSTRYLKSKLKELPKNSKPFWYISLPKTLANLLQKRLSNLFSNLRYNQQKGIGMSKLGSVMRDNGLIFGIKKFKSDILFNLLKKIIVKRTRLNLLWKYFQIWNIMNVILHLFIDKISKNISNILKQSQKTVLLRLKQPKQTNQEEYKLTLKSNPVLINKKIRYASFPTSTFAQNNWFLISKGLELCSRITINRYYKRLIKHCHLKKNSNVACEVPDQEKQLNNSYECNNDFNKEQVANVYYPIKSNPNNPKLPSYVNFTIKNTNSIPENHQPNTKQRVVIKPAKNYDSIEKLDKESDLHLFDMRQEKEKENIISFSRLTNKIKSDSSGFRVDSSLSQYNAYNPLKDDRNNKKN